MRSVRTAAMRRAAISALLCAPILVSGCLTRHVRQDVYRDKRIEVFLRLDKRPIRVVEKGHDHPAAISAVRVAHILSRLDIRKSADDGGRRTPAIPTQLLYSLANGVSQALSKADQDQEVVALAIRVERTFKILHQDYLTSFVAYVRGEQLFIHLSRVEWAVPDLRKNQRGLPQPRLGEHPMRFKLFGGTAMTLTDRQSVAVNWRDPIFKRPTRTKLLPTGEVRRKTILLESPEELEDEEPEGTAKLPTGLSAAQLRALADLEESREAGRITEAQYRARQREIVSE